MHEVTYDFLVVYIKASQKSLGDKPKSVYIFLQTPRSLHKETPTFNKLCIYSYVVRVKEYDKVASVAI